MAIAERVTTASLEASVDLKGHLDFVGSLLERYGLEDGRKRQCRAALEKIRARRADPDLYLAIIGEFSSGKSTLVNALIGQELLPADVLPATTAAATLVRYGESPALRVEYTDGRQEEFRHGQLQVRGQSLRDLVTRFTSVEEVARTVARVTVDSPAPVLRKGLVVVDMPGSNVENRRHVELAGWVIRDMCDAALVAIPANIPAAETLIAFLKTHLEDSLHRCIFVATKIDLIAPRERPRMLATIASRLSAKLGIAQPLVLPASATAVLSEPLPNGTDASTPGEAGETYRKLQAEFCGTAETIARTLQEQRTLILLERLSALLSDLLEGLEQDLQTMERRYRADHEALEKHRIRDLAPYIAESKKRHGHALESRLSPLSIAMKDIVSGGRTRAREKIAKVLDSAVSQADIRRRVREDVQTLLTGEQAEVAAQLGKTFERSSPAARAEIAAFEARFLEIYTTLRTLGGRSTIDPKTVRQELASLTPGEFGTVAQGLLQAVQQDEQKEDRTIGAGAVTGGILGQVLIPVPVLGAVLGAFVGSIVGAIFVPSLDDLRSRYRQELRAVIDRHFDSISAAALGVFEKNRTYLRHCLDQTIDRYFVEYDCLVKQMVAADRTRLEELSRQSRRVRGDLAELGRRREDLQQVRTGLQKIHKL